MSPEATWWAIFITFVLGMLALDLGVFHRKAHEVSFKEAVTWSCVWITLALIFNLGIYLGWFGPYETFDTRKTAAIQFLTGYLVEYSLSIDNVFVFALLFAYFKVPREYQHRILFWGVLGAIVLRAIFIFAGVALLSKFHWLVYIFGGILIISGFKMWSSDAASVEPEKSIALRLVRRIFPMTNELHGQRFFVRIDGALKATPLFAVLIFVEWSDVVFAVDSIPAILAITRDSFIVFTSNIMAILGLRSLYFALSGIMDKFRLLHYGLSAILVFIGTKMLISPHFYKVDPLFSLCVIVAVLIVSIVGSLLFPVKATEAKQ